ncbi:MAG: STAS domain-containing protein [Chitinivibrionales bacterium]|nr:STAS domain-containing protein [Chitinivibrionales bacterium]MBD3358892.1 STAS domain-containing protein [Chitinivibrionales bacterium]
MLPHYPPAGFLHRKSGEEKGVVGGPSSLFQAFYRRNQAAEQTTMSENIKSGAFYYAQVEDVCVIRLVGSITWKISPDFEHFLDQVLVDDTVRKFFLDLSQTTYIDSTNLGLLARLHLPHSAKRSSTTKIYSTRNAINTILDDVGFTTIFAHSADNPYESIPMRPINAPKRVIDQKQLILKAHQDLARLNRRNRATFQSVVDEMERDVNREG